MGNNFEFRNDYKEIYNDFYIVLFLFGLKVLYIFNLKVVFM